MGLLRIVMAFAVLTAASLISESLLGNTPINDTSPKVFGHLFTFLYLILMFVVSHVNLPHIHVSTYPKNDIDAIILSVVLERTVRLVATVNAVLEEYNSCLPNNK